MLGFGMKSHNTSRIRARCIFSGTVQGVCFRYNTKKVSSGFDVAGFVRNLPDGTVEMVAEGERAEVENFISEVARRMGDYIRERTTEWGECGGEFSGFDIRLY